VAARRWQRAGNQRDLSDCNIDVPGIAGSRDDRFAGQENIDVITERRILCRGSGRVERRRVVGEGFLGQMLRIVGRCRPALPFVARVKRPPAPARSATASPRTGLLSRSAAPRWVSARFRSASKRADMAASTGWIAASAGSVAGLEERATSEDTVVIS
jgi:hypothetical protein